MQKTRSIGEDSQDESTGKSSTTAGDVGRSVRRCFHLHFPATSYDDTALFKTLADTMFVKFVVFKWANMAWKRGRKAKYPGPE